MSAEFKRLAIGHLPTPLESLGRLAEILSGPALYIKRDDATGLAGGGNKVRKLEYLGADALAKGANCLITVGGPQSNHARMTAALAARLGLECRLYLKGGEPDYLRGNLLLDHLLGAHIIHCDQLDYPDIYKVIEKDIVDLRCQGLVPYTIPVGGSAPLGVLGYVRAVTEELVPQCRQLGIKPDAIVVAAGSGGTMAGILLGLSLAGWEDVLVQGYSVSYREGYLRDRVAELFNAAAVLLGADCRLQHQQIAIDTDYIGPGYGIATPGCLEALQLFARHEGLLLDSVYTAKAAAGMIADIRRGRWEQKTVIFIHTGGWPALLAKDDVENWVRGGCK